MKLKKFRLYWTAEISGFQTVEAFDEQDAQEQFDGTAHIDDLDDTPISAQFEEAVEVKNKRKLKGEL